MGLKILEGRDFTLEDSDAKQPVAIVNASFAHKYWGNQSPLGHRVRIFNPAQPLPWRTIVGVVPDTLMQGPFNTQTDSAGFYVPLLGASPAPQFCTLIVRPHPGQSAETLGPALSKAVAQLDSNLPIYFPGTPARSHAEFLSGPRLVASLFSIFGVVAFHSFRSRSLRRDEFLGQSADAGIRNSHGAGRGCSADFQDGDEPGRVAIGHRARARDWCAALFLGVVAAGALQNILFKVNALDPFIYTTVAALLTAVAAVSCFVPARRATRVNPMVALRTE